jgi:hypothetical protein
MPGDGRGQNTERLKIMSKPYFDVNVKHPRGLGLEIITPFDKGGI